jgi:hypothetical protein
LEGNGPYVARIPILDEEETCNCGLGLHTLISDEHIIMKLNFNKTIVDYLFIPDEDVVIKCPECGKIWRLIQ